MIRNKLYRDSIERLISAIEVDGKSFLITGASGLIGSALVDLLMLGNRYGKNNEVYVLSRSRAKIEKRFVEYISERNFHIIEQDICKPLPQWIDLDFIIHGASNADPVSYAKHPVETILTNILGGRNVLDYGKIHPLCKITVLSTFEVYGRANKDTYKEIDAGVVDINAFRCCYPESKRTLEVLSRSYYDEYSVHVNVARLCSIFGPTMNADDSKAHAQFLRNAVRHQNVVLKSEGLQRRTYCYVNDAITAILFVLFHGLDSESYNVSNENCVLSISELANMIARKVGVDVIFELPSALEQKGYSNPQNCILDNSKLRNLGWQGQYRMDDAISECIDILSTM